MSSTTVRAAAPEEAGAPAQPRVCERAREAVVPMAFSLGTALTLTATLLLRARLGR